MSKDDLKPIRLRRTLAEQIRDEAEGLERLLEQKRVTGEVARLLTEGLALIHGAADYYEEWGACDRT